MAKGTVKWFDNKKGYGFIVQEPPSEDIFVHYSSIKGEGFKTLEDGDAVEFDIVPGKRGLQAENVCRIGKPVAVEVE